MAACFCYLTAAEWGMYNFVWSQEKRRKGLQNFKNEVKQWTVVIVAGDMEHQIEPARKRAADCGCPFVDVALTHAPENTCADETCGVFFRL